MLPRMTAAAALLLVCLITLSSSVVAQESGRTDQDATTSRIIDHGFGFTIKHPGPGWVLLDEQTSRGFVPESIVGVKGPSGLHGAVIVEDWPESAPLDGAVDAVSELLMLDRKALVSIDDMQVSGVEGRRVVHDGLIEGIPFRFVHMILIDRGHLYQFFICGQADDLQNLNFLDPFWDSISFLPGDTVPGRKAQAMVLSDRVGEGFRVKDGVFESPPYGYRVRPNDDWQLAVGLEATQLQADASVALVDPGSGTWAAIVSEGATNDDYAARVVEHNRESLQYEFGGPAESFEVVIDGVNAQFDLYRLPGDIPSTLAQGTFFRGSHVHRLSVWSTDHLGEKLKPVVLDVSAQVEWLEDGEIAAVAEAMAAQPDPMWTAGLGYSLRNGEMCSYEFGFSWNRPEEGWWKVNVGDAARLHNEAVYLSAEEQSTGSYVQVIVDDGSYFENDAYHAEVLARMVGASNPTLSDPIEVDMGAGVFRLSTFDLELHPGLTYSYYMGTIDVGALAFQVMGWSHEGHSDAARDLILQAIQGFELHSHTRRARRDGGVYFEHEQLGYRYEPSDRRLRWGDATPDQLRGVSDVALFSQVGVPYAVTIMTVAFPDHESAKTGLGDATADQILRIAANGAPRSGEQVSSATLDGHPAVLRTFRNHRGELMSLWASQRGRVCYYILAAGEKSASRQVSAAAGGFRWLD